VSAPWHPNGKLGVGVRGTPSPAPPSGRATGAPPLPCSATGDTNNRIQYDDAAGREYGLRTTVCGAYVHDNPPWNQGGNQHGDSVGCAGRRTRRLLPACHRQPRLRETLIWTGIWASPDNGANLAGDGCQSDVPRVDEQRLCAACGHGTTTPMDGLGICRLPLGFQRDKGIILRRVLPDDNRRTWTKYSGWGWGQ